MLFEMHNKKQEISITHSFVPPCPKSLDTDTFYQKQAKNSFLLALILTHRLYPNAGTPPLTSTEPTIRQVTSFDYWQSVHCQIKAEVNQPRNRCNRFIANKAIRSHVRCCRNTFYTSH